MASKTRLVFKGSTSGPTTTIGYDILALFMVACILVIVAVVGTGNSDRAFAAPSPLVNIYTTTGNGQSQACWRKTSGRSVQYYCRNLQYESVGYLPSFAVGKKQVVPGNWTIVTRTGAVYEGCTNPSRGFTCSARATRINIRTYNSSKWRYYGSALVTSFRNTGTAAECIYNLYYKNPDITSCL